MHIGSSSSSTTSSPRQHIGMLSTYPPQLCGLATFAAALEGALAGAGHRVDVIRIADEDGPRRVGPRVAGQMFNGNPASVRHAALMLSRCDAVIIQHEYGIFGGPDGEDVIDLLRALDVPTIVVLHTVPRVPTVRQRELLIEIAEISERVVVMSRTASDRLTSIYGIDPWLVTMIPHGAAVVADPLPSSRSALDLGTHERPELLTWGLLGPGKGVEHVLDALRLIDDPRPRYTVAGVTHPKVFLARGDEYRLALVERARSNGVAASVTFDDTYRDLARLTRFVASAAVVVLPYDSHDQVTSGVLVDALAAGRPVIATAFPHAVELLGTGAGIIVPHADPRALADAISAVMADDGLAASMAAEASRIAPSLSWTSVGNQYVELSRRLVRDADSVAM